ncbi:stemmadenine O-acetyltransferase-like isoform X2 [Prosopis cineraria]|uniref:stemmadenine O-acetyltransferase-like isoform X2 n=1 Tax=Prosopis cineraria TaxID=364024 RepID=UPI0024107578|nr:stemmadenine O-acetyltransferase-like isoform X2 [Prosopis cineraria]
MMMKFEMEVISKEIIKPLSPTPQHFRRYQLSFLDQVSPLVYNPLVLFYAHNICTNPKKGFSDITTISGILKRSLSYVLTHYYPLAGRLIDNTFVDCNDEGVPYSETRVKGQLLDFIQNPNPSELNYLIPFQLDKVTEITFGVQVNVFECGGIAIGACLSHQISDALSFFTFLNCWASVASGSGQAEFTSDPSDRFVSANLFPPRNTSGFDTRSGITNDNIISKRFVFNASVIEALRTKYSQNDEKLPSRVEALSAFIWSRYVLGTQDPQGQQKTYAVVHAVNLRPRMEPPLPPDSFGNYYRFTMTLIPTLEDEEEERNYGVLFVKQVREQMKKIDKDYVRRIQEGANEHLDFLKDSSYRVLVKREMISFNFTSLCRFPLYDADFGWGKPTWVSSTALTFKNLVVFIDNKNGGGIEAYISLTVEDMAKFEADKELLACVNKSDG